MDTKTPKAAHILSSLNKILKHERELSKIFPGPIQDLLSKLNLQEKDSSVLQKEVTLRRTRPPTSCPKNHNFTTQLPKMQ